MSGLASVSRIQGRRTPVQSEGLRHRRAYTNTARRGAAADDFMSPLSRFWRCVVTPCGRWLHTS